MINGILACSRLWGLRRLSSEEVATRMHTAASEQDICHLTRQLWLPGLGMYKF